MVVAMGAKTRIKLESRAGGEKRASPRRGVVEVMSRMTREVLSWRVPQYTGTQQRQPSDLLNEVAKIDLATGTVAGREQQRVHAARDHSLVILRECQIQI
jgi:hypothetical protein